MTWTSTATVSNADIQRTNMVRERKVYPVALAGLRVWDAMHTTLPGTAASDDAALITGTPATDAPTVQGLDSGGLSTSSKFAFEFALPPEYDDGQVVKIRVSGGMITTISDGTATIDFAAYEITRAGAVGADLVTTAATSINSLTHADFDFALTATGLVAGDKIIIVGTLAVSDTTDAGVMIPELATIEMVMDVKG